jgi:putative ABC transport system permease protein
MNLTNLFKIALRALSNNKMRGFLTMLGIIIGIASVITMLALGQGSKRSIKNQIGEMGSNMIMIQPGADMRGGVRQDASAMETLKLKDYEDIRDNTSYLSAVSPTVNSSGQVIFGSNNAPTTAYGGSPDYMTIQKYEVSEGEMFTDQDVKTAAKVCLVGKTVVDNLFTNGEDPVGKVIRFKNIPFRIIGVIKSKGYNTMGMDQDDMIIAPYTTIQKRVLAITYLQGITCSAIKEEYSDKAIAEITDILRTNHKLKATDDDDFNVRSMEEIMETMNTVMDTLTILLAAVAGISLIVGGIGIMNIMYVSVTERTREIGLRMSIGAKGIDILTQFLIESILLSVTGGVIGVILGVALSLGVSALFPSFSAYIQPWSVILSFLVCTFTGVFFGWYPAKKAAKLDPIEALRYE